MSCDTKVGVGPLDDREGGYDAATQARRRMGLVRRYAPLLTALIARPGMDADAREKGAAFRKLIVQSDRAAQETARLMADGAFPDMPWLISQSAAVCSELVANRWYRHADTDITVVIDQVARTMPAADELDDVATYMLPDDPPMPEMASDGARRVAVRLSLMKSMLPIVEELWAAGIPQVDRQALLIELQDALLAEAVENQALARDFRCCATAERVALLQAHIEASARIMKMSVQVAIDQGGRLESSRIVAHWRDALDALVGAVEVEVRSGARLDRSINVGIPNPV